MTWTVTKEEIDRGVYKAGINLNVRAIIPLDQEVDGQAELKGLIASLQKHVKEGA